MLTDNASNFSVILNSQATGSNIQTINGNGSKKYSNSLPMLLDEKMRGKRFKMSVNMVSAIVAESTLSGANLYLLEFSCGNGAQSAYQNGSALSITNSLIVPLEIYPSVMSASALVSSYYFAKTCITCRFPTDIIEIRIRNASDFSINSSFPNYVVQVMFEEVLETKAF